MLTKEKVPLGLVLMLPPAMAGLLDAGWMVPGTEDVSGTVPVMSCFPSAAVHQGIGDLLSHIR